jgi:hypothetical protein
MVGFKGLPKSPARGFLAGFALGFAAAVLFDRARAPHPRRRLDGDVASDALLVLRSRAALGHFTSHPKSIRVSAHHGRVTLAGAVLAGERADLVAAVRGVRGVRAVSDRLTTYLDAIGVPELQGGEAGE